MSHAATTTGPTKFLTGLATLMLIVAAGFGLYLLVGAAFGVGPDGHDVGIHTRVAGSRLTGLPQRSLPPNDLDVIVRVSDASSSQIRWVAARDLAPGALIIGAPLVAPGPLGLRARWRAVHRDERAPPTRPRAHHSRRRAPGHLVLVMVRQRARRHRSSSEQRTAAVDAGWRVRRWSRRLRPRRSVRRRRPPARRPRRHRLTWQHCQNTASPCTSTNYSKHAA